MTNFPSDQLTSARGYFEQSQDVVIAVRSNPTVDNMAAALALYLALSSQGKRVSVVCSDTPIVELSHLVGIDKVSNSLSGGSSGRNLVISFPYEEGSIEKVSYNIEGTAFNLVIEPRQNYPTITSEMIRYTYSGGNTDVIITINVARLDDLGTLYQDNQGLFTEKPVINIDTNAGNGRYGRSNIVDPSSSSVCELMTNFMSQLGYQMDADSATNLLQGISNGSQNFTSANTSAATFEAAAICLRNGARKAQPPPAYSNYQFPKPQKTMMGTPMSSSFGKSAQPSMQKPPPFIKKPYAPPSQPPIMQQQPMQRPQSQQSRQQQPSMQPPVQQSQPQPQQQKNDAPPDWLKPKIYKGSTLL